jgi:hypothetical protein
MRYSLKTMLIAGAIAPPVLAWLWMALGYFFLLPALYGIVVLLVLDDHA